MAEISVIIPTYGLPFYLEKAINSVLNQSFPDLELIIVDDNNPNTEARVETERLVDRLCKKDWRIQYVKHSRNQNGATARNTGAALAQGKYVSFLDSDDEYAVSRLQKCKELLDRVDDTIAGIYTGCEFRRNGKPYRTYNAVRDGNFLVETLACKFMFCSGSNLFIRKKILDELRGFDTSFLRHQDYEFLVRVFKKYSLCAINEVLLIKNNDNFNVPNVQKFIEVKKQYLHKYEPIINSLPIQDINFIMHANYVNVAETALAQKEYRIAHDFYDKALLYGNMSLAEHVRRILFPIYNQIRNISK